MGVRLVKYGVTADGGTYDHNKLENRDMEDQHPISAITGLQEKLDNLDNQYNEINKNFDAIDEDFKKIHTHENYNVLKEFTEADSILLYKGKPIIATSTHESELFNTEAGVHGLRYFNNKLQHYANGKWNDITTGGGGSSTTIITDKDIDISPNANNALVKYSNGYYVQKFLISKQTNNALVKYSDGYYVPKIPANNATLEDVKAVKDEINEEIKEQRQISEDRYDVVTNKILEISANTTKHKTHEFFGSSTDFVSIADISELYSLEEVVIINLEFMIVNTSDKEAMALKIQENGIDTMNITLMESEVQKYKLSNVPNTEIFVQGNYKLYLYVNYI